MRDAPDFETAHQCLDQIVRNYQASHPELCRCLTDDREASLNHLQVPIAIADTSAPSTWWSEIIAEPYHKGVPG